MTVGMSVMCGLCDINRTLAYRIVNKVSGFFKYCVRKV